MARVDPIVITHFLDKYGDRKAKTHVHLVGVEGVITGRRGMGSVYGLGQGYVITLGHAQMLPYYVPLGMV